MKKTLLIASAALLLLSSCGDKKASLEETAKKNIAIYLNQHLNDSTSYQPASFGTLDSLTDSFYDDPNYKKIDDQISDISSEKISDMEKNYNAYSKKEAAGFYDKKKAALEAEQDIIAKNYKEKFIGYRMEHKYRAKNGFGALMQNETVFVLDSLGNVVKALK
ncbi:hypothetical protein LJ707_13240 [Mucilaginibacter sp. UR6-1]|uniref:hypothetical protein n=1 Tax=Mucilaginibacter sp. UR6-1 TaxID=1435643 RepID=UPI001E58A4C9|nr:hypothetical protein [Mucilaginibacter sp. UR6-1]MCC8409896.1 hypothetical protein [Mucilaginibacter sp. UR6-1]